MNNLNLDITKYNCDELYEIFSIDETIKNKDTLLINHFNTYKNSVLSNNLLSITKKESISNFLNDVLNKLIKNLNISNENDDKNLTFSSLTNNLLSSTSDNHPIIANQNELAGTKANTYDGDTPDNTNFSPGYINPINVKSIRRTINIDSRFRDNYFNSKSTDFIVDIPDQFKKVVKMKVSAFEIPNSIYNITNSHENNYFYYSINGSSDNKVNIQDGIYTTQDLSFSTINLNYKINEITGKSKFTCDNSFNIYFNKDKNGNYDLNSELILKLGWLLGFRLGEYTSIFDTNTGSYYIESEGICNLQSSKYLFLSINDFTNAANNHFVAAFNSSILSQHIISRYFYPSLVTHFGKFNYSSSNHLSFEEDNNIRTYFGPVNINRLHIQILDEYGRVVDFNNMDWSFTLSLDMLYD